MKSSSTGKNSPLSSMSSSSMCSVKSIGKKSHGPGLKANEECLEDEMNQAEMASSSSASSSSSYLPSSYSPNHLMANLNNKTCTPPPPPTAANISAMASMGLNNVELNNALLANAGSNGLSSQMVSLLNHANAMSKIKSSLLESLLSRKLPNKFFANSQQSNEQNMASMAAAVVAAAVNSSSMSANNNANNEDLLAQSKSTNLTKLLQNIVEMNHFNHANSLMNTSPSSASSSSSSSTPSIEHEKQNSMSNLNDQHDEQATNDVCNIPDCNCKPEEHDYESEMTANEHDIEAKHVDIKHNHKDVKRKRFRHPNREIEYDELKSNEIESEDDELAGNNYQEETDTPEENKSRFYDDEEEDEDHINGQEHSTLANSQRQGMDEEMDDDLRSRSPSNSSKSSGCSSMSSMIQNQFVSSLNPNKLLVNRMTNCITPPINHMAIENHLKNFQQRHMMLPGNPQSHMSFHHAVNNSNKHNLLNYQAADNFTNQLKRKKNKEYNLLSTLNSGHGFGLPNSNNNNNNNSNNSANSIVAAAIRNLQGSPNTNERATPVSDSSLLPPPLPGIMSMGGNQSNVKLESNIKLENNQIRYSSEIWRCPYCCYETTSASRYNSHLVCHGWKPYLCPHCGSRSNRLPDMRTHISTFHPEFNVNTFVVLGEEEAKSTLKDYMKNRALINRKLKEMRPQPKFKCKMCPYASLYQFNLTKHVKSVHLSDIYNSHSQNNNNNNQNNLSINNDS